MPARLRAACVAALFTIAGCGGGMPPERPHPAIPRASEEELRGLEQRIAEEEQQLPAIDPAACVDRCRSVEAICEASARICEIAEALGDASVDLRCAQASRSCNAARGGTDPSCPCAATPSLAVCRPTDPEGPLG